MSDLVYSDEKKKYLRLEAEVASGSQAKLMSVLGDDSILVKVLDPGKVPPHAAFVWDTIRAACGGITGVSQMHGVVRKRPAGEVLGYVVENVRGPVLNDFRFTDHKERVNAAWAVAATYAEMDEREVYQGDGHFGNQIVTGPPGRRVVKLIDVDSFSFATVTWPDGTEAPRHYQESGAGFGPPEFCTGAPLVHGPKTSGFVLAEIVYRILKDRHPAEVMTGTGDVVPLVETVRKKMYGRFEPEELKRRTRVAIDEGLPWDALPRDLRWLFNQTFQRGRKSGGEDSRPACKDYLESLTSFRNSYGKLFLSFRTGKRARGGRGGRGPGGRRRGRPEPAPRPRPRTPTARRPRNLGPRQKVTPHGEGHKRASDRQGAGRVDGQTGRETRGHRDEPLRVRPGVRGEVHRGADCGPRRRAARRDQERAGGRGGVHPIGPAEALVATADAIAAVRAAYLSGALAGEVLGGPPAAGATGGGAS
ncbi:hypothetical protein [Frigoriglobus tundricola]|uniref:Protein kinase domain-containing protein n=1 Tax=Frigoriglobus tundricola TaxID=2774151 RepID=A0A6M5Z649_9BACT|nr:hypothetical protein [Frigoriglobus tundricola]QJX01165.1 hypothetical protein FTUN_8804 [Frigoriglobus tundricola]